MSKWNMDDEDQADMLFNDNLIEFTESEYSEQSIDDIKDELMVLQELFVLDAMDKVSNMTQELVYEAMYSSCYTYQ